MQIPNCESNPVLYWSLILDDQLIYSKVSWKEKISSCGDFLSRRATRTAHYQFCSLQDLHNAPKHSVFPLNQILAYTKAAQQDLLAVFGNLCPQGDVFRTAPFS